MSQQNQEAKKTTRVQMELTPSAFARLQVLKDVMDATSYSEVVKTSLKVTEVLMGHQSEGAVVQVKYPDGRLVELQMIA
jgi:hypothetical protein